jgi:hypothetical protein
MQLRRIETLVKTRQKMQAASKRSDLSCPRTLQTIGFPAFFACFARQTRDLRVQRTSKVRKYVARLSGLPGSITS